MNVINNPDTTKKIFTLHLFFTFFCILCVYGQNDTLSQKIIDDMAAKFKTYPSVSISFSVTVTQLQDNPETVQDGKLWVKGNRYKLEIPDFVIYFDGSKIYQYFPEAKEVNISPPDPDENVEDFQLMNPQTWFNLSSKSFKSKLVRESVQNGRKAYEIDLYPIEVKTARYSHIHIMIEKSALQLVYLKAFLKDGVQYAVSFKPFDVFQTALRDSYFTFNHLEHPNVEVIDLTF